MIKSRITFAVFILALLFSSGSFAQEAGTSAEASVPVAELRWTPPTEREDGTPLDPATELEKYVLTCTSLSSDNTVGTFDIPAVTSSEEYSVRKAELLPEYGVYDCTLKSVDTDGNESRESNEVTIAWDKARPNAPTNFIKITG